MNDFYNRYLQKFGTEPDAVAANTYDAVMLLISCLEKTTASPELVKSCLYSTKSFTGVGGVFSIDSNGDVSRLLFIKTVKDGRFVRYQ